jgi:two-component system OmpR family response regulator
MNSPSHILLVDDDPIIRSGVARFLGDNGLQVTTATDGPSMRQKLAALQIDLILLDLMLVGEDGLSLLRYLRAQGDVPVIILTAAGEESDRVVGLELGADDYVCKPFSLRELLARMRVVLRRQSTDQSSGRGHLFYFDAWIFDTRARNLTSPRGGHVELTTGEFSLLQAFVEYPNRVLNRDQLLDLARGRSSFLVDRVIDVLVMRLRRKIEPDPKSPRLIKTVRNGGYIFTPVVTRRTGGARYV